MRIAFLPAPGINSDDTTFSAEGRWADGNNVRFVNGLPQVIGDYRKLFETALSGMPTNIFPFTRNGAVSVAYGTSSKLYVGSGTAAPGNRSPAGLGASIENWSFGAWGSTLLASPGGGKLYEQSGSGTATEVTQAPDQIAYLLVTPERQVLALGCNEEISGAYNGLCIRGSDIEDYADWTTSPTNNAFEHILDGAGAIVAARMVGSYVAVWTDTSFYLGSFVGDPDQTYRFDRIEGNCGLIGPRAVTLLNGIVYWFGKDLRLRAWAPGALPEIVPCTMYREISQTLENSAPIVRARLVLAAIPKYEELWMAYPTGSGYVIYSARERVWSKGNLLLTALESSDLLQSADTGGSFVTNVWGSDGTYIYAYELGRRGAGMALADWHIQSADQSIEAGGRRMAIREIIPDFRSLEDGLDYNISLTLYVRDNPQAIPVARGPYTLTAEASGYVVDEFVNDGETSIEISHGTAGIAAGRIVTFAGVNGWANGADTGRPARFTLTADFQGYGGSIWVTPAFISSGPDRNITALPTNGAAVTVLGTASRKSLHASGRIMAVRFGQSGSGQVTRELRIGKPVFDMVPLGER